MTTLIIIVAAVSVYAGVHLGAGHAHHRHRRAAGLRPSIWWSAGRGPWVSVRLPGGFRVGHRL
jgi:hypothetical protein